MSPITISRRSLAATAAITAIAFTLPASLAAATRPLTPAERAFATAYHKLAPSLNRVNASISAAINKAPSKTDAQIATQFTAIANAWHRSTQRIFRLHVPAHEAQVLGVVHRNVTLVEGDLRGIAHAGRTHNVAQAELATKHLGSHLRALGGAVAKLKHLLHLA